MTLPNKPRGTQDIYPPRSLIYQKIQQIVQKILQKNNYQLIIFPTFEAEELFTSSLGSTTDIVHKEMYNFADRKGRKLVLRPEGTASVVRLVCENRLIKTGFPLKFYYWANMFRYERPQKGRHREFWQLGVELINASGVLADFQILKLISDILHGCGIKDFTFNLNYLGDSETRKRYKNELEKYIEKTNPNLCENCQRRHRTNPLRILDCSLCRTRFNFPLYKNVWSDRDNDYVNELNRILDKFNLPYQYDYFLVRGLDYYTGLVFEVNLKDEKALLGGGRYDKLYREMGNIDAPALGFAVGIERLVDYLETSRPNSKILKLARKIDIFFLVSVSKAYLEVLAWKKELEKYSLKVEYNLEIREKITLAKIIDYYQPKLIVVLGEKEWESKKILVKDCSKNQNFLVKREKLVEWIKEYLILPNSK